MKRALVVEDEKDIQEILVEYLKNECGIEQVDVACDGLEGFHKSMTNSYDVITLDHKMPYFLGADLLKALRAKDGPNKFTVIFFISAHIPEIPEELRSSDYTYYLEKPLDFNRFSRYVKMSLKKAA